MYCEIDWIPVPSLLSLGLSWCCKPLSSPFLSSVISLPLLKSARLLFLAHCGNCFRNFIVPAALPCRTREKPRLEGTSGDHLNPPTVDSKGLAQFTHWPNKTSLELLPAREIPPLLWATCSNVRLFSQWRTFSYRLMKFPFEATDTHCFLSCHCVLVKRVPPSSL